MIDRHNDCNSDCSDRFCDVLAATSDNAGRRWFVDYIDSALWTVLVYCPADVRIRWFIDMREVKQLFHNVLMSSYRALNTRWLD